MLRHRSNHEMNVWCVTDILLTSREVLDSPEVTLYSLKEFFQEVSFRV